MGRAALLEPQLFHRLKQEVHMLKGGLELSEFKANLGSILDLVLK